MSCSTSCAATSTSTSTSSPSASPSSTASPWAPRRRSARPRTLPPYPTDIRKVPDHVAALVERYAALSKSTREGIDHADEAGDADTADIFTAFSRALDKDLWFLRSHLE